MTGNQAYDSDGAVEYNLLLNTGKGVQEATAVAQAPRVALAGSPDLSDRLPLPQDGAALPIVMQYSVAAEALPGSGRSKGVLALIVLISLLTLGLGLVHLMGESDDPFTNFETFFG